MRWVAIVFLGLAGLACYTRGNALMTSDEGNGLALYSVSLGCVVVIAVLLLVSRRSR